MDKKLLMSSAKLLLQNSFQNQKMISESNMPLSFVYLAFFFPSVIVLNQNIIVDSYIAGSAWTVLSHEFVEYVVWGWDNLPRTLLMYYTNFISSPEGYFQTVVCNDPELAKTVVNSDLHYISWDNPPKQHPHNLGINDTEKMIASNAAFARKFKHNDSVLDVIDEKLLHREKDQFTPGGWCSGDQKCSKVGNMYMIKPGPGSLRLRLLVTRLIRMAKFGHRQCI